MTLDRARERWCRRVGHTYARLADRDEGVALSWCLICGRSEGAPVEHRPGRVAWPPLALAAMSSGARLYEGAF
jgi:hypothetical protein